jgi:oxygen-independent coproporphyrinogen-3 oxidase
MVAAIKKEILLESAYLGSEKIHSIYFGGGTPSLLETKDVDSILCLLQKHYRVDAEAEITLEANPDDIHPEKLMGWKFAGVNRLSVGVQSFFEEELRWMNRAHNSFHAKHCIEAIQHAGFSNLTIDLIYGSPLLTDEMWFQNVETATAYGIPHLSCYALTVEEKTPLHKSIAKNAALDVENEKQARQFMLLMQWLKEKGYEHYEVSNFAKPGMRSRHNSSYWKGVSYLGIGPSAHSYNGLERRWNVPNNNVYIATVMNEQPQREMEILSLKDRINESIMISLRTMEGLDLDHFEMQFGKEEKERVLSGMKNFSKQELILVDNKRARLTDAGMLAADGVAASLFKV